MEELQTGQTEGVHQAGSPEHINEMLAKVDNPVQVSDVGEELVMQQATQGRPEWLPEKFSTPQDLLNAYNQLEQQYTQVSQQQQEYEDSQVGEQETVGDICDYNKSGKKKCLRTDKKGIPKWLKVNNECKKKCKLSNYE